MGNQSVAEKAKALLSKKRTKETPPGSKDYLSTGSTLLNLACSGSPFGGFAKGRVYLFVGDSSSGKTWLALNCLAEAGLVKRFKNYRKIFDGPENGALMNIRNYFGEELADSLEAPYTDADGLPVYSRTVEEVYFNIADAIEDGRPFIYILDSMDAVEALADIEKFEEKKKAHTRTRQGKKAKEVSGSFGMAKAKANSEGLRNAVKNLPKSGSIVILIAQSRDAVGLGAMLGQKTRAGGRALKFYATLEMWSTVVGKIKKEYKGKKRNIGMIAQVAVKKNRLTGNDVTVRIPFLRKYGIDDLGSCVDYLVAEGHWKKGTKGITAPEFDVTAARDKLIEHIENNELEKDLRQLVGQVWQEIEDAITPKRKPRYG